MNLKKLSASLCLAVFLLCSINQSQALNSESLAFFEKPTSVELNGGVLEFNSLLDLRYVSQDNGNAKFDDFVARGLVTYQKQLSNDWDLSLSYLAEYQKERGEEFEDLARIGIKDQWGEIVLGDVSSLIYERSNRQIAAGLLGSDNDAFTVPLETAGLFYQYNTPSTQWMGAIDDSANVEIGVSLYLPINALEYQLSARYSNSENDKPDAQGVEQGKGVALVGQIQRGRWIADAQIMREDSLGLRYYLARGFTLNLGASVNNSKLFPKRFYSTATSLRYEF